MNQRGNASIGFLGLLGLLGLLFIGLKLGGIITWSWWLVLLPIYGSFVLVFVFIVGLLIAASR